MIIAVVLNFCYLYLDWKLALFMLSIILGKYIWVDFIFDYNELINTLKIMARRIMNDRLSIESLTTRYALTSIILFIGVNLICIFLKENLNVSASRILHYMIAINISIIALLVSFLGGLEIQNGKEVFDLINDNNEKDKFKK